MIIPILVTRKGPSVTGFSPMVHGGFRRGKNVRDCQKYFVVDGPSPICEAVSVIYKKCPSDEIDMVFYCCLFYWAFLLLHVYARLSYIVLVYYSLFEIHANINNSKINSGKRPYNVQQ